MSVDTRPLHIKIPGPLSLESHIHPRETGEVDVKGFIHVKLSHIVDNALSILPWLVRRQIKTGLIKRELVGSRFRLRIPNICTVVTDVDDRGVLQLSSEYHVPLARPVGHKQIIQLFEGFAQGLHSSGLQPVDATPVQNFLSSFKRSSYGELNFLELFEGKAIHTAERSTPALTGLTIETLLVLLDSQDDLQIEFTAFGQIPTD